MWSRVHVLLAAGALVAACGGGGATTDRLADSVPSTTAVTPSSPALPGPSATTPPPSTVTPESSTPSLPVPPEVTSGLEVRVPDHLRYGSDGLVLVAGGVESGVTDDPVQWASTDGAGGFVYSVDDIVWWRPAGGADSVAVDAVGRFARSIDGRPTLIAETDEMCGDCCFFWLVLHDLANGEETPFACAGGGGDATGSVTDVGGHRYVFESGMDLANYSTNHDLTIGELGVGDTGDTTGVQFPGNPYPNAETCQVHREGESAAACEVHGRLSPDGMLLATWYRPDFSIVVDPMDMPPEVVADAAGWLERLDTLPADVMVHELEGGIERYRTQLPARSRIVDFDGRFLVVAPCLEYASEATCPAPNADWTIIDISGRQPPVTVPGQAVLLRPQGGAGAITEADAPPLGRGDSGEWVSFLQQALVARGSTIDVDGIFGPATEANIRDLQQGAGIDADGIVGSATWAALFGTSPVGTVVLGSRGLGPYPFGTERSSVEQWLTETLGPPEPTQGLLYPCARWGCPTEEYLLWARAGLYVGFADRTPSGDLTPEPVLLAWTASARRWFPGGTAVPGGDSDETAGDPELRLRTESGIGIGSTVAELGSAEPATVFRAWNEGTFMPAGFYVPDATGEILLEGDVEWNFVEAVQQALNEAGAGLIVDGIAGPATRAEFDDFRLRLGVPDLAATFDELGLVGPAPAAHIVRLGAGQWFWELDWVERDTDVLWR
jgi:peptidoglycan hydrolase-like protein with peptidoglycan-binding domain